MKTNSQIKPLTQKINLPKNNNSIFTIPNVIVITAGIVTSIILLLIKISWIDIQWKILLIPLMVALQIIFITTAIKNRYKKI
jgi:hypothetical protein